MNANLKKLVKDCLSFLYSKDIPYSRPEKSVKWFRELLALDLIRAFPDDLERDAATGHLVLDTIESDDLTPEEEVGIAEGDADIAAGRVYSGEEFKKRVAWKDEPAAAQLPAPGVPIVKSQCVICKKSTAGLACKEGVTNSGYTCNNFDEKTIVAPNATGAGKAAKRCPYCNSDNVDCYDINTLNSGCWECLSCGLKWDDREGERIENEMDDPPLDEDNAILDAVVARAKKKPAAAPSPRDQLIALLTVLAADRPAAASLLDPCDTCTAADEDNKVHVAGKCAKCVHACHGFTDNYEPAAAPPQPVGALASRMNAWFDAPKAAPNAKKCIVCGSVDKPGVPGLKGWVCEKCGFGKAAASKKEDEKP